MTTLFTKISILLAITFTGHSVKIEDEVSTKHFEHYCIINDIPIQDWTDEDYNKYLDSYCGTDESEEYWEFLNQQYYTGQPIYQLESGPNN